MSDRIAYLVGDREGFDHHQWPMRTRDELVALLTSRGFTDPGGPFGRIAQVWPAAINIQQIMALAWRVKKWEFTGTLNATAEGFGATETDPHGAVTASLDFTLVAPFSYMVLRGYTDPPFPVPGLGERELQLINVPPPPPFGGLRNFGAGLTTFPTAHAICHLPGIHDTGSFDNTHTWGGFSSQFFSPLQDEDLMIWWETGELTPYFSFSFFFGVGTSLEVWVTTYSPDVSSYVGGVIPVPHAGSRVTVVPGIDSALPFEVPLFVTVKMDASGTEPGTMTSSSGGCDFTLTAKEFFPYKNSAGDPVYDTATGAQINDPFS